MPAYEPYETDQLMSLLAAGDEAAFDALYQRFWPRLFAIAPNRLQNREAAEDVVHDVFASFWANRATAEVRNVENYLAVAVKYAVLVRLRRELRQRDYLRQATDSALSFSPETQFDNRHLLELVRREVEKLPERCRLVFKYSREQGLPVKEIARVLDVSPKTVENQLAHALRQLRVALRSLLHFLLLGLFSLFF